jgi:hypothetical protein
VGWAHQVGVELGEGKVELVLELPSRHWSFKFRFHAFSFPKCKKGEQERIPTPPLRLKVSVCQADRSFRVSMKALASLMVR